LVKQQRTYGIKTPSSTVPFARLDMKVEKFLAFLVKNPFLRSHASKWLMQAGYNAVTYTAYLHQTRGLPPIMSMPEFSAISRFFRFAAKPLLEVSFLDVSFLN
jgi:hypothetical protein